MNFLAHLYLSGESPEILLGNFIGDFIRGKEVDTFQKKVYQGILLHREIDFYTDRHHLVSDSKDRLWAKHRHYSSVIVDIFYDHFLAKNWDKYSPVSLEDFAANSYATIQSFEDILPEKVKNILPHMINNNWLVNYGKLEGINKAMQGMARRASFQSEMAKAVDDLKADYEGFEHEFSAFFPQLVAHSKAFLDKIVSNKS